MRALLRPFWRLFRAIQAWSLHGLRRRRAELRVKEAEGDGFILFMCTGNICRSVYAEKVFRRDFGQLLVGQFNVASAGFLKPDRPSPEPAIRIAAARGLSLEQHRSRRLDPELLASASLVVSMERKHERQLVDELGQGSTPVILLGDLDPVTPLRREITDPWGRSDEVFVASFDRIERCVSRLGKMIIRERYDIRPES